MILQLALIWAVVAMTLVLFVKGEQKRRDLALRTQALAYAKAPRRKLAFEKIDAPIPQRVRRPVLSPADLKRIAGLGKSGLDQ